MADDISNILNSLGAGLQDRAANTFASAVDSFNSQGVTVATLRTADITQAMATSFNERSADALQYQNQFVGSATNNIPDSNYNAGVRTNDFAGGVGGQGGGVGRRSESGANHTWQSSQYGDDVIAHQPKFKFLFKVKFEGQETQDFYFYVINADKPKIRFEHQDVNYYNFRTKVLTKTTFDSLSMTFWDELGNTTNAFFVEYLNKLSGQGSGQASIDEGMGKATSSHPYQKGYSFLKKITIEQIFANGIASNRFYFWNPRIESFDFDSLAMDDNSGSLVTIQFNYDAISCETVGRETIHTWGAHDLLQGGGPAGSAAGSNGSDLGGPRAAISVFSGSGAPGSGSGGFDPVTRSDSVNSIVARESSNSLSAISDLLPGAVQTIDAGFKSSPISSAESTISRSVRDTLQGTISNFSNPTNIPQSSVPNAATESQAIINNGGMT